MEINRINNRSVVYIVEDHGTLQDLMVQGSTTTQTAAVHSSAGMSAASRQNTKLMASRLSSKSGGPNSQG